jgi:hypothetical protein
MSIKTRTTTMMTNRKTGHSPRAEAGIVRAWRLVTSFFSLAARSLPGAGV